MEKIVCYIWSTPIIWVKKHKIWVAFRLVFFDTCVKHDSSLFPLFLSSIHQTVIVRFHQNIIYFLKV